MPIAGRQPWKDVRGVGLKESKLEILLVEDEPHDVFFVRRALEQIAQGHTLHSVANGEEAIAYLRGEGPYAERGAFPCPNIILCDLKMPRMNGFEFLEWVRGHPECSVIPTVIISSSSIESDVRRAYQLGANAYMRKPTSLGELVKLIKVTYEYWGLCECPPIPKTC